jgi:hypothetical protein
MSEPMFVHLLLADGDVVGAYFDEQVADKDMHLCKQGDLHNGITTTDYEIRMLSIIKEV